MTLFDQVERVVKDVNSNLQDIFKRLDALECVVNEQTEIINEQNKELREYRVFDK